MRPNTTLSRKHQAGQALVFGIVAVVGSLASLVFLFNTSQLTAEKTKLVNTADAVAYSAGVMHARVLNFNAYTNRALMANEVMIAQAVSIASWTSHVVRHTEKVAPLACLSQASRPLRFGLLTYVPICALLSVPGARGVALGVDMGIQNGANLTVAAAEVAKVALKGAQANLAITLIPVRKIVMQQVADANYINDGTVHVDDIGMTDNFLSFGGKSFIQRYAGADRGRVKEAVVEAAYRDEFVKQRSWTSTTIIFCPSLSLNTKLAEFRRRGGTELIDFDEWKAMDTASLHEWKLNFNFFGRPSCDRKETELGYAAQAAANGSPNDRAARYGNSRSDNPRASARASSTNWAYSGLPAFYDLSDVALQALPAGQLPRLRFSVRLTRAKNQTRTSDGASTVKPSGKLNIIEGKQAFGVLAAVATSEVFFQRPVARVDGKDELSSLFNPYWQVHLVPTSPADTALALARKGEL
jgi:hypothetical protein